jgi:trk system potassium uptake protein
VNKRIVSGYALILNYLGIFSVLIGLMILTPLFYLLFNHGEVNQALFFLLPAFLAIGIGLIIVYFYRNTEKGRLERNQDAVLVVFIWLIAIFYSALPFLISGNFTFTHSIFEATSGYSTTGLTVVDVESLPKIFLLFRSLMQFYGGVGLVLIMASAVSDKFQMRLYYAEGHNDKLLPNLIRSARMILSIYVGYILIGAVLYVVFGMSIFDAINHSISAVATGGFSTRAQSIGYYQSLPIEIITIVLMILGGTNFFVHLLLIRGKLKQVISHVELKFLGILTLIIVPLFIINLMSVNGNTFFESLRIATFQFFTTITTTGLQTISSVNILPVTFIFVTYILMMIGASTGSTAGGMKLYRVALGLKSIYWNILDALAHRKTVRKHFINKLGTKRVVEKDEIAQNFSFLFVYMIILFVGITIFTLHGYSMKDSIFEFTSVLGTIGLSVGIVGSHAPNVILWTSVIGMLFARLESYVILIAVAKIIHDLRHHKTNTNKEIHA